MSDEPLPDFQHPPVTEIIAAVQFRPLPLLGIREVVQIARALKEWEIVDTLPAIPPMAEQPPGRPEQQNFNIAFGDPPIRVVAQCGEGRWTGQLQQDRVAIHERKITERPSFRHVGPKLAQFATAVGAVFERPLWDDANRPDFVEVIYENQIAAADGGWDAFSDLGAVLRGLQPGIGVEPFSKVEQLSLAFSFVLGDVDAMAGRLRVFANPQWDAEGRPVLALRLVARRLVQELQVDDVLERCHADIVRGFTSITTDDMHKVWGRFR